MLAEEQTWLTTYRLERLLPNPELALSLWLDAGAPTRGANACRVTNLVQLVPVGMSVAAIERIQQDAEAGGRRAGLTPSQWVTWLQAEGRLEHPCLVSKVVLGCGLRGPDGRRQPVGPAQAAALVASAAQVAAARSDETDLELEPVAYG